MGGERIFVVMPAYNAGLTLERVFARIPAAARDRISRYVVVDDGSTDDTREVLTRLAERFPGIEVLEHSVNQGYGAAQKTLLSYALEHGADVAVGLHADGQYSPERIPALLEPLDAGRADIAQGSRLLEPGALRGGMPVYKFLANKLLTAVENTAFGMSLAEFHSGFMVYSRRALERIPFAELSSTFLFDLEMLICAHILGLGIAEVAVPTIYADEVSHLRPVRYGLGVLDVVRRTRRGDYHALVDMPRGERGHR